MAWTDYILTPNEIYPNLPVFSASYTLNLDHYVASIHYDPTPAYTYHQFSGNYPNTNNYTTVQLNHSSPVFESDMFGYSFYESTHDYKAGSGYVNSSDITWNSDYDLIRTRRYIYGQGYQSEYKSFYNANGAGGSLFFAYSNSSYYNHVNNLYSPDFDHWRWQSNQTGSLSVSISANRPAWLDPDPPDPDDPTYPVHLLNVSDGLLLDDAAATAAQAAINGWTISGGKAFIIF